MSQADAAIEQNVTTTTESLAAQLEAGWNEQEAAAAGKAEPIDDEALEEVEQTTDTSADEDVEANEADADASDDDETNLEESEEQEPDAEEGENFTYENVNDLAEATGQSIEDFLENTKITRKIDGVEEEVTLAELRNGNQRDADYRRKTTELAESKKAFNGEVEQAKAALAQQVQEAAAITATLEQQLMSEFQSIDWNALELSDREEWLVQRQKFGEKQTQIEAIKQQTQQKLSEHQQEVQNKQLEAENKTRAEHAEMLKTAIPEWSDVEVWKADDKQMRGFLSEYGFNEAEVANLYDHRLIKLARDAMKNKGKTSKVDATKKMVKKLPKMLKPANKPDKVVLQKKQKQEKRNKFIKKDRHTTEELADFLRS